MKKKYNLELTNMKTNAQVERKRPHSHSRGVRTARTQQLILLTFQKTNISYLVYNIRCVAYGIAYLTYNIIYSLYTMAYFNMYGLVYHK